MQTTREQRLLRVLGVGFGIAVSVGGTVGVGILRTPGLVASHIPDPWILMMLWVIGGIYSPDSLPGVCHYPGSTTSVLELWLEQVSRG